MQSTDMVIYVILIAAVSFRQIKTKQTKTKIGDISRWQSCNLAIKENWYGIQERCRKQSLCTFITRIKCFMEVQIYIPWWPIYIFDLLNSLESFSVMGNVFVFVLSLYGTLDARVRLALTRLLIEKLSY